VTVGPFGKKSTAAKGTAVSMVVAAVDQPSMASGPSEMLLTGLLLLGPGNARLMQLVVEWPLTAPRPVAGQELPATVDGSGNATLRQPDGTKLRTRAAMGFGQSWDSGVGGMHDRALAEWLAGQGFQSPDFGGGGAALAPGLATLIDQAAVRRAPVIDANTDTWLLQAGERVQGEVVATYPLPLKTRILPPGASSAWLTLQVTPPEGAPYQATLRMGFRSPERFAELATVGHQLPLRRNPTNPMVVTIERTPVTL
jgi:hypothetical protein